MVFYINQNAGNTVTHGTAKYRGIFFTVSTVRGAKLAVPPNTNVDNKGIDDAFNFNAFVIYNSCGHITYIYNHVEYRQSLVPNFQSCFVYYGNSRKQISVTFASLSFSLL